MFSNKEIIASSKIVDESLRKSRVRAIARYRATRRLIQNHQHEYDQIIRDEGESLQNLQIHLSEGILMVLGEKRLYRNAKMKELRKLHTKRPL